MSQFELPPTTNREDVQAVLSYHHDAAGNDSDNKRVAWLWAHYWLQGLRETRQSGHANTHSIPSYNTHDRQGIKRVRVEKTLAQTKVEEGRILKIDQRPAVNRKKGVGLMHAQQSAASQAVLDHLDITNDGTGIKSTLVYAILAYGTVGMGVFPQRNTWRPGSQLIMPWELRSIPANPMHLQDVAGEEWHRWVPLKGLKDSLKRFGTRLRFPPKKNMYRLNLHDVPVGARFEEENAPAPLGGVLTGHVSSSAASSTSWDTSWTTMFESFKQKKDTEKYVQLREFFIRGGPWTMSRYCLCLGDWLAIDIDYANDDDWQEKLGGTLGEIVLPIKPIHIFRYQEVGGFYGRSFVDRLLPVNREMELLVGESIDNMRKVNRQTKLYIPISGGVNERNLRTHARDSYVPWQPDLGAANHKPFVPDIPNSGDTQGRIINMLGAMQDDVAGHGPLMQGDMPGRADSLASIKGVAEFQALPLQGTGESLSLGWSGVYRAQLAHVKNFLNEKLNPTGTAKITFEIGRIDRSVMGLSFDPDTGEVSLTHDSLGDPATLDVGIRAKNPQPAEARLAGLDHMLERGIISEAEWAIGSEREGLDLPHVFQARYNSYETAWIENVLMFGDGKTPLKSAQEPPYANEKTEVHAIHLAVHMDGASGAIFQYASDAVQRALLDHIAYHEAGLSRIPQPMDMIDQATGQMSGGSPGVAAAAGAVLPGVMMNEMLPQPAGG